MLERLVSFYRAERGQAGIPGAWGGDQQLLSIVTSSAELSDWLGGRPPSALIGWLVTRGNVTGATVRPRLTEEICI